MPIQNSLAFVPLALVHFALLCSPGAQTVWANRTPATSPTPRHGAAMASDDTRGKVVLFGGDDNTTATAGDTWLWDGSVWTKQAPATSPPPRTHASAVTIPGGVLLFGGSSSGATRGDTWLWNGTTWAQLAGAGPTPRNDAAMAYDHLRRKVVLYGGNSSATTGAPLGDTWEWDVAIQTWSQVQNPIGTPGARRGHTMFFDPPSARMVLHGGYSTGYLYDTWQWDGSGRTWSQRLPPYQPTRFEAGCAFDPTTGRGCMFGGEYSGWYDEMWEWTGDTWELRAPAIRPSPRQKPAMCWDTTRGCVLVFGGYYSGTRYADTWTYRTLSRASYTAFGSPCSGTGTLKPYLAPTWGRLPWLNSVFSVEVAPIPVQFPQSAYLFLGAARQSPPIDLAIAGAPGCFLYVVPAVTVPMSVQQVPLAAVAAFAIPNVADLAGGSVFLQAAVFAAGSNALSFLFTDGGQATLGAR